MALAFIKVQHDEISEDCTSCGELAFRSNCRGPLRNKLSWDKEMFRVVLGLKDLLDDRCLESRGSIGSLM